MLNPFDLTGRTILVTGASSGIGRASAVLLSQLGANLVLVARNRERLNETREMLEGNTHFVEPIDLSVVEEIPGWMKSLAENTGPLSGLVHSAGVQITKPLQFLKSEAIQQLMEVNLTSAIYLSKGFRQRKVCTNPSSIVLLSSVMGLVGQPGVSLYSASKGALISFARSLALEFAAEGIRVNCIAPGHVHTEMAEKLKSVLTPEQVDAICAAHPLGVGTPEDVAHSVAFLLADTGRWITGTTLVVDGGYTAH